MNGGRGGCDDLAEGQIWPIKIFTSAALKRDPNIMSSQVSEQSFILGNRVGEWESFQFKRSQRMCNCFLMGEDAEGRKTIVTTDYLSLEIQPLRTHCPAWAATAQAKSPPPLQDGGGEFPTLYSEEMEGRRWEVLQPGSCKGVQHCVDRGANQGRLYFGKGTQLTVWPGELETLMWRNWKGDEGIPLTLKCGEYV